jgi:hypothetical protein
MRSMNLGQAPQTLLIATSEADARPGAEEIL